MCVEKGEGMRKWSGDQPKKKKKQRKRMEVEDSRGRQEVNKEERRKKIGEKGEKVEELLQTLLLAEVTVPVVDPQHAAVCLLVGAAIAGHQDIVDVRNCHVLMEMVLEIDAEAGAEFCKIGDLTIEEILGALNVCLFGWLHFKYV